MNEEGRTLRRGLIPSDEQASDHLGHHDPEELARAVAQVDRAVRHHERVNSPEWISPFLAPGLEP
jgi:hypothetical protein